MMPTESRVDRQEVRRLVRIITTDPGQITRLTATEQDLAIRVARRCRILGRLGVALDQKGLFHELPQTIVDQVAGAVVMAQARSRLAMWELDRIEWAVGAESDIPLIAMKGCAYILLGLPNAVGRVFADVDIMTSETNLPGLEARLNRRGWQTQLLSPYDDNYYRKWTHELPPLVHIEREMEIDLHHNVLPRTARLHPDGDTLVARARPVPDSRYLALANEDLVLHAIVHLFVDSDFVDKLRDLIDIVELARHFEELDVDFWSKLIDRSVELGFGRPLFYAIRYGGILLDLTVPRHVVLRAKQWSPNRLVLAAMDRLVARALIPVHPDRQSPSTAFARQVLYMRSHWLRMPPYLLAYHLTYKFLMKRLRRNGTKTVDPA